MRLFYRLFLLLFLSGAASAQIIISGKVIDPLSREALPFVNIGIRNKNIGSTSKADGSFSISLDKALQNDTLIFSLVGYSELKLPVQQSTQKLIPLFRKAKVFDEITISTSKLSPKKFGLKNRNGLIHFIDGSIPVNDMFEIAQLIRLPDTYTKLSSVNLYISENSKDSVSFRINFYSFDGNRPGERLTEKNIFRTDILKEGWLSVDISSYDIYAKNACVVSIEFFPSAKRAEPVKYDVKLGGTSRSFVRKSSLGTWTVPPHHYLLHVTALVPETPNLREVDEEKETLPTTRLYSDNVKDSFSIFVRLPKNYRKKKQDYPVVYLLDANAFIDLLPPRTYEQAIIIGIGYRDVLLMDSLRQRDYTFPQGLPEDSCSLCGGAEKFRNFIQKELIPGITQQYRCRKGGATLAGHSLGGYFTLYCLLKDVEENNPAFKNYIPISPSLEYSGNYIVHELKKLGGRETVLHKKVYSAFGEREDAEEGSKEPVELNAFRSLMDHLKTYPFLQASYETYPGLGHMETVIPGLEKGLRFVLPE